MNMFNKVSILAVFALTLGVVAPVSASNAAANVPAFNVVVAKVATWVVVELQSHLGQKFTVGSPLATLEGNHMTIEAKRLPDTAPLRGFSGPRKKQR